MKPRVRIYKVHDLDLMCYYFGETSENITFSKLIKRLIREYINGESLSAPSLLKIHNTNYPIKVETTISFLEPEDADIIAFLNNIIPGQRNGFFKNLLRQSIQVEDFIKCYTKGNVCNLHPVSEEKENITILTTKQSRKKDKIPAYNKAQVKDFPMTEEISKTEESLLKVETQGTIAQSDDNDAFDLFGALEKIIER